MRSHAFFPDGRVRDSRALSLMVKDSKFAGFVRDVKAWESLFFISC